MISNVLMDSGIDDIYPWAVSVPPHLECSLESLGSYFILLICSYGNHQRMGLFDDRLTNNKCVQDISK